ncbi:Gfo/Idh/MocA family oxidoreductase [Catenovulum sp. 2E275]|uniref:Gfo/Idh/MocA family protein n=1 Tax=Catenovulum sp. 2E275 TaxID=2980497 RepID=UPI0021CE831E|nr:Gfo/Idh/MocA family oxidoreductase [Catenovulum sp. 2E275]MCU4675245.1 Gfo/Idh/MocA family oxidoreductase [Catenovulum sp. 2E275]
MRKNIRWGIIGCGNVTEVKSGPAYQKVAEFELKAVMRRNAELAKDYAQRHHVELYFDNADELIHHPDIDAVYIATPPDSHKEYALKVAAAGKIACIEKPLAPSYADSLAIVTAFEQAKLPLFVAYYRRSLPRFLKVKALLEQNVIGEIRTIHWTLHKPASNLDLSGQYNWRTDKRVAPAGYFDDLASHGLDLFSALLGEFKQVNGFAVNQQQLYSAFDAVTASWVHQLGVTGSASWNFAAFSAVDKVTIMGDKGEIEFSIFTDSPVIWRTESGTEQVMIEHPENVQLDHVENIKNQLISGKPHPSNGKTALHTAWVMAKILNQI